MYMYIKFFAGGDMFYADRINYFAQVLSYFSVNNY